MKAAIVGDLHWCTYSSIWRQRGNRYSSRLENLIDTLNWVERTADLNETDVVIYLGDFFDRADVTAEELTALRDIQFNYQHHIFLVGNHEIGRATDEFSTAHLFTLMADAEIIDTPTHYDVGGRKLGFLPYILENDRKSLAETLPLCDVIFSHNDIQMDYGNFVSTDGYDPDEIVKRCTYFFNGHIHNFGTIADGKIINIGNITGQNFSEDGFKYHHQMAILDLDSMKVSYIENPFAASFYKLNYSDITDPTSRAPFLDDNSIVTIKCRPDEVDACREYCKGLLAYKIIIDRSAVSDGGQPLAEFEPVDHLAQFKTYILENLGNDELVVSELAEVLK